MPPKRPKKQQTQSNSPQPSTSQAAAEFEEDDQLIPNTQATAQSKRIIGSLSEELVQKKVNELVQYLLVMDQKKYPIKRADINKVVLKEHSRAFPSFVEEASKVLREVFGFDLVEVDKTKSFILLNRYEQDVEHPLEWSSFDNKRMALVMVILSVIFMKGNIISHEELFNFLKKLGLDIESPNQTFGDLKKLITNEFVRQGYLQITKSPSSSESEYRWGFRAQQEISKRYALDFVCQIYGIDTPEMWASQYQDMIDSEQGAMDC